MKPVEVTEELEAYMVGLLPKRDKVLARMEDEAHREGIPIVDAHEGALLRMLVHLAGAKRILELGTATGYSGIWLLHGSEGGMLTTFEVDVVKRKNQQARNVAFYNELIAKHPRLESAVIRVRDGLSVARIKD